jgi:plastocyanin
MKKEFTLKKRSLILLFTGIIFISLNLSGQTSYTVTVSNFEFSPKELSITVGDTVVWKNVSGMHNVDGLMTTYPSNPESFGNDVSSGWTYSHVFNIAGTYDYRCDPHFSLGMTGEIIVEGTAAGFNKINTVNAENQVLLYPIPAADFVTIDLSSTGEKFERISILNLVGKEMLSFYDPSGTSYQKLDINGFNPGLYLMKIDIGGGTRIFKFIKQ